MDGAPRGRERSVGFGGGWELTSQNKTGEAQKTKYLIKLRVSFKFQFKLQLTYNIIQTYNLRSDHPNKSSIH